MKKLITLMALAAIPLVGCGKESEPGGPGANPANGSATNENGEREAANEDRAFRLQVPQSVSIDQGEREEVSVSLDRGDKFDQEVEVTFDAPAGLTITPKSTTIRAGQDEVKVQIAVAQGAVVGKHPVTVQGKPQTGESVDVKFEVEVNANEQGEAPEPGTNP